jgi:hypothetical protein
MVPVSSCCVLFVSATSPVGSLLLSQVGLSAEFPERVKRQIDTPG